mmetsp:Transcript_29516/g.75095  ORF Transcript_29516/g.75095 Transcript_29516/m.75095 type:complete len:275 (-) Transcript_29516:32-856(-)
MRHWQADLGEVGRALGTARTVVRRVATGHENHLVDLLVDAAARLVDAAHHGVPGTGKLSQSRHDVLGLETVQARRRLVDEDEAWHVQKLQPEVHALALTARDAALTGFVAADQRVPNRRQAQGANDPIDPALTLRGRRGRQPQARDHVERLLHGAEREQRVVLLHVSADGWKINGCRVEGMALCLQQHVASELSTIRHGDAPRQGVQEAGLAAPRGSEDRRELAWPAAPEGVFQDDLARLSFLRRRQDVCEVLPSQRNRSSRFSPHGCTRSQWG